MLTVIGERRIACRIKLLFNDYAAEERPGSSVITAYDQLGNPHHLEPHVIWRTTAGHWEAGSIGPFRPRDIEWLAIPCATLAAIREELPVGLKIVTNAEDSIIRSFLAASSNEACIEPTPPHV